MRNSATGTSGTTRAARRRDRRRDRRADARRAADVGSPAKGERRPGRRLPVRRIDSSTNAALFSEGEETPVKTFSIGYEGDYESYQKRVRLRPSMATHVGAEHHERLLTGRPDRLPAAMMQLQDEPIADPVCVPVYYVSKLARDNGVTVCQVGEGADELFWGYPSWKTLLRLQRYDDLPVPKHRQAKLALAGLRLRETTGPPRVRVTPTRLAAGSRSSGAAPRPSPSAQSVDCSRRGCAGARRAAPRGKCIEPIRRALRRRAWEPSHLNWMTYLDLNLRLPELLLMRIDKMSMGVSLEGRVPFLDHKFVEFAMSIPERVKTNNGTLKYMLKKAVRGIVPDELIDRPKQGFGVPVREWFTDLLGDESAHGTRRSLQTDRPPRPR